MGKHTCKYTPRRCYVDTVVINRMLNGHRFSIVTDLRSINVHHSVNENDIRHLDK